MRVVVVFLFIMHIAHAETVWDSTFKEVKSIYDKTITMTQKSPEDIRQKRFHQTWDTLRDKFIDGYKLYDEKTKAQESSILTIGRDKDDIQEEIDEVLNDLMKVLIDDDLLAYKTQIAKIKSKKQIKEIKLAEYKEARITAPIQSYLKRTKSGYDTKIKNTQEEIKNLNEAITSIQIALKKSFHEIGIELSSAQINTLLARANGDDIIQITLIMDILKQITNQIMQLMKSSNESLVQAKRYYGMHMMSLALVVHIQQHFIDKVDNQYIPKVIHIANEADKMIDDTQDLIDDETNLYRHQIYQSNLKSQKLTLKVAQLYKEDLINSKEKLKLAQERAKKNLQVAYNTYSTVSLSSGLYDLIAQSQLMFNEISRIQIPSIIPFENIQIEQKYKELTNKILEE
ncbi:MAG: hypothetical protein JXQ76_08445 [Campylobacterales bacterium]|nr:hypothetical protein [Campylobacterales bacterium]